MRKILLAAVASLALLSCGKARLDQKKKHFLHKGNVAFKEKLYHESIRYYTQAIELDSGFAQAHNNLGVVYLKTGKFDLADKAFTDCLVIDSVFTDAYYNRSTARNELKNYTGAILDLNQIKSIYQPIENLFFSKGLSFFGMKTYDSAAHCFMSALSYDSSNVENYLNLGSVRFYQGKITEATDLAQVALKLDEESVEAYNLLGMIDINKTDYDLAEKRFNKALSLRFNDAFALNNRGYVYLKTERLDEALKDINQSILINPDNPWPYRNKGIYYMEFGDLENAKRLLIQSIEMDATMPLANYYLGQVEILLGNKTTACDHFSRSMEMDEPEGKKAYQQHCQ